MLRDESGNSQMDNSPRGLRKSITDLSDEFISFYAALHGRTLTSPANKTQTPKMTAMAVHGR